RLQGAHAVGPARRALAAQRLRQDPEAGTGSRSCGVRGTMDRPEIPWIVSVDDHVIEPPSVWVSRLPAKYHDRCPRVLRLPAGELRLEGARYVERPGTEGPLVDYW